MHVCGKKKKKADDDLLTASSEKSFLRKTHVDGRARERYITTEQREWKRTEDIATPVKKKIYIYI